MKRLFFILFAGASLATVALSQETSNPPAEQKQAQASEDKCCGKDCCKNMKADKHDHASKKDKAAKSGMACCK